MRVALIHDWLTGMRGGEKCLEAFCELFPQADLYTLIYSPEKVSPTIRAVSVHGSWLNRLPGIKKYYRYCLPLFPYVVEHFHLKDYELLLSSSHCVAKGVLPHGALHIAYIHAPMRYVWDMYEAYFGPDSGWLARAGMSFWRSYLQAWDRRSSERVDFFVANSRNVGAKVKNLYGREATVIPPPVDYDRFFIAPRQEPYYLLVSALVPYKRIDLAVAAFNGLKLPLRIVGDGPLRAKLEAMAGPSIEFLGWVDHDALPGLYASCQALIFPGEEDFGIVPLEAQASGRPVIAYGKGGVLESVVSLNPMGERAAPATGIFFRDLTSESLREAVLCFQKTKHVFDPPLIRQHVAQFSRERFKAQIQDYIEARLREHSNNR